MGLKYGERRAKQAVIESGTTVSEARRQFGKMRDVAAREAEQARTEQKDLRGELGQDVSARRGLVSELQSQARGEGPSLAQAQMRQAQDRSLAQQLAAAGRSRGAGAAATQRQLMRGQQSAARQIAQDSAIARMQERQAAQQQLGSLTSQSQQQLGQQLMANRQLEAQQQLAAQQGLTQSESLRQQALLDAARIHAGVGATRRGEEAQKQASSSALMGAAIGGMGAIGSAFAMGSDKNNKTKINLESAVGKVAKDVNKDKSPEKKSDLGSAVDNVAKDVNKAKAAKEKKEKIGAAIGEAASAIKSGMQSGTNQAAMEMIKASDKNSKKNKSYSDSKTKKDKSNFNSKDFLSKLKAYSYEYKDPEKPLRGEGKHFSVMAQDLEKSGSIGKSMVQDTNQGKIVDYGKGFGAILAAQVQLNERLKELESKKKKKS